MLKRLFGIMRWRLLGLSRGRKQVVMVSADALAIAFSVWASFALRLGDPLHLFFILSWWLVLVVPVLSIPGLAFAGMYNNVVRYLGPHSVFTVLKGAVLVTLVFVAVAGVVRPEAIPRTSFFIFFCLVFLLCGGLRFVARIWFDGMLRRPRGRQPVAIYGAGRAGMQLANSLFSGAEFYPRVFIDDDPTLRGQSIAGLRVFPGIALPDLIERYGLEHVLLAMPSVPRARRRAIVAELEALPVHVQTMPELADIVSGRASVSQVQEVDIDDLLGRGGVEADAALLADALGDRNVLITGAGGSIGSEIARQVLVRRPRTLILLDHSEFLLYRTERELRAMSRARNQELRLVPLLGSVTNQGRMEAVMRAYEVDVVYHAAAYKHVPIVEENVLEGLQNNVFGTLSVARAAMRAETRSFVLVSTDKAVRPTNVMGASKRLAELIVQAYAADQKLRVRRTVFSIVRFGNVLGSSGSVVPLFREQIRRGGPVTVTHPDVTRYFMSIPEAASLVVQAGAMAEGGEVFVLDMGEPIRILDLAKRMIRLSGFSVQDVEHPDGDIPIEFVGLRPGEKLHEELLLGTDVRPTAHPMIQRAAEAMIPLETLQQTLDQLQQSIEYFDYQCAHDVLVRSVDGYRVLEPASDLLARRLRERGGLAVVPPPTDLRH
jgi:UDP-N-acetylglucosamine 4,6-dehydratase